MVMVMIRARGRFSTMIRLTNNHIDSKVVFVCLFCEKRNPF